MNKKNSENSKDKKVSFRSKLHQNTSEYIRENLLKSIEKIKCTSK